MIFSRVNNQILGLAVFLLVAGVMLLSCVYLSLPTQAVLGGMLLLVLLLTAAWAERLGKPARIFILLIGAFMSARYWIFRTAETLIYTGPMDYTFAMLLYLAESYGILIYLLGMFVNVWPVDRRPAPLPDDAGAWPTVDVFIPTYDEPVDVVETTLIAATQMRYPAEKLNVYLLDDGGTRAHLNHPDPKRAGAARQRAAKLMRMAADYGAVYHARAENTHAKAGNINDALLNCDCVLDPEDYDRISCVNTGLAVGCGELILVLDCDHVPTRDFLENTVGFFPGDPKLFMVQTPHFFINPAPVEKRMYNGHGNPSENEMFYGVIQRGLDFWNAAFFCGSAAVMRRSFLVEAGGISGETITEDAETALGLHARGLRSIYLLRPMIIGLSPETFDSFILQRSRWAQGMVQIFRLKNPLLQRGLTIPQRLCYFNACFFWFFGLARIIFYFSPMLYLFFGLRIYTASLPQVLAYGLPHLFGAYVVSNYLFGRYRHPFFSEFYETIQSIYLVPGVLSALFRPRSPEFRVTPKAMSQERDFLSHLATPFYLMSLVTVIALVAGSLRISFFPSQMDAFVLCTVWNVFNLVLLLGCLGVVWESRQVRGKHRYPTREPARLRVDRTGEVLDVELRDLSGSGAGMILGKTASPPPVGSRVMIEARDSQNEVYRLAGDVRHTRKTPEGTWIGFAFDLSDRRRRIHATNFVFGDSRRWRFFGQAHPDAQISSWRGILNLIRLGAAGAVRNVAGLYGLLISGVQWVIARPAGQKKLNGGKSTHDVGQNQVHSIVVDDHFRERLEQRSDGDRTAA